MTEENQTQFIVLILVLIAPLVMTGLTVLVDYFVDRRTKAEYERLRPIREAKEAEKAKKAEEKRRQEKMERQEAEEEERKQRLERFNRFKGLCSVGDKVYVKYGNTGLGKVCEVLEFQGTADDSTVKHPPRFIMRNLGSNCTLKVTMGSFDILNWGVQITPFVESEYDTSHPSRPENDPERFEPRHRRYTLAPSVWRNGDTYQRIMPKYWVGDYVYCEFHGITHKVVALIDCQSTENASKYCLENTENGIRWYIDIGKMDSDEEYIRGFGEDGV